MRQDRNDQISRFLVVILFAGSMALPATSGCDRQGPPPAAASQATPTNPTPPTEAKTEAPGRPAGLADQPMATSQPTIPTDGVVAYYFHRTLRCMTCLAIEKSAKEAIEIAYLDALNDGRLAWLPVDYEAPANWHFAKDYALETSTLVLVEMRGGKPARWKALPKTWELIGDPGGFQEYVWAEVKEYLGG